MNVQKKTGPIKSNTNNIIITFQSPKKWIKPNALVIFDLGITT